MTTVEIPATMIRVVYGNNATWSTARSTSTALELDSVASNTIGSMASYYIWRNFLKFDTSGIPVGANISSLKLRLTAYGNQGDAADTQEFRIKKYNWSGSDPIDAGNRETVYDGALAADNDTGVVPTLNSVLGNVSVISSEMTPDWLNSAGYTYYAFIDKCDYDNSAPTANDRFYIYTHTAATASYRPTLIVVYTTGGSQAVWFMMKQAFEKKNCLWQPKGMTI
jgi:hypothetical protein